MRIEHLAVAATLSAFGAAETIVTLNSAVSNCPPLGAVLPPPKSPSTSPNLKKAVAELDVLQKQIGTLLGNATGLSISIGSAHEDKTLATISYSPAVYNTSGVHKVDGDTVFRIGSVSKVFTVLGLLLLGDKISFSDPITKYVPELEQLKNQQSVQNAVTTVDWKTITIDALASQLAGVGNDLGNDLSNNPELDLTKYGLPAVGPADHSECGALPSSRPCTWKDFWADFGKRAPIYRPYTTPAYSDMTYDVLDLVIERISGMSYADFIRQRIFTPMNMTRSYVTKPENDSIGFIPVQSNFWSTSYGFLAADGGLYSTANDLVRFGQGIMGHKLLDEISTNAWLKPRTHTSSLGISVGAPWEIARANTLTVDGRIIDVYSKNGGLTDYNALFLLIPDYSLVVSMVSAGPTSSLTTQLGLATKVLPPVVKGFEAAGKADAKATYAGTYANKKTNSSITLDVDKQSGLHVTSWVMNSKDILKTYPIISSLAVDGGAPSNVSVRLFPTSLQGGCSTAWRAVYDTTPPGEVEEADELFVLQAACQSWASIDNFIYAYNALDDFVFGLDPSGKAATSITPRAFRQTLARV